MQILVAAECYGCRFTVLWGPLTETFGSSGHEYHLVYDGNHYDVWEGNAEDRRQSLGENPVGQNILGRNDGPSGDCPSQWERDEEGSPEPVVLTGDWRKAETETVRIGVMNPHWRTGKTVQMAPMAQKTRSLGGRRFAEIATLNVGGSRELLKEAYGM